MAYSYDLRKKALDYLEKGYSKKVSQTFGVTARTLFNSIEKIKTGKRRPYKIEEEKLKAYLQDNPDS